MARVWFALLALLLLGLGALAWWQARPACDKASCGAPAAACEPAAR